MGDHVTRVWMRICGEVRTVRLESRDGDTKTIKNEADLNIERIIRVDSSGKDMVL